MGSFRAFSFFNKPLSGITRFDLIWALQEPVVPNVICIFLSVHLFVLSVFPLCLPVNTACLQLRVLGKRPATKYQKKKNLGSQAVMASHSWQMSLWLQQLVRMQKERVLPSLNLSLYFGSTRLLNDC